MKKILIFAALAASAVGAFAQVTVQMQLKQAAFNIRVYGLDVNDPTLSVAGNAAVVETPAGSTVHTGPLLGGTLVGPNSGTNFTAQLWSSTPALGASDTNEPESNLKAVTNYTTTFRTINSLNAGYPITIGGDGSDVLGIPSALGTAINPAGQVYSCTAQLRVWDNRGGITSWDQAVSHNAPRAKSAVWGIGRLGNTGTPPSSGLTVFPTNGSLSSFNLYIDPNITTQPVGASAECSSGSATFTVAATSSTGHVTYQWYRGNTLLANATNASLTLNPVHSADAGTYTVAVTSSLGVATSTGAVLAVTDNSAPVLTLTGGDTSVELGSTYVDAGASSSDTCAGVASVSPTGSVNTSVVGSYTLTFVANDGNGNSSAAQYRTVTVVDTTAPSIALNGLTPPVECHGTYTDLGVTASDASGSVTLTTNGAVNALSAGFYTITYTATDASLNHSSVTRTVQVVDTTAPSISLNGSTPVTTHKNVAYSDAGVTASDTCSTVTIVTNGTVDITTVGDYTLTFTASDSAGNHTSVTRVVSVIDTGFLITSQPAGLTNAYSTTATFTVGVDFPAGLTYQWANNGTNLVEGGVVTGSTSSSLTVASLVKTNSGIYTCLISGGINTNTTADAILVVQDPGITVQPTDVTVLKGATHIFSVTAAGSGTLKYQWYSISNATSVKLTGKTTSTLSEVLLNTNLGYYVVVTNVSGAITSRVARATVNIAPVITGQPGSFVGKSAKVAGNNVSFIVKVATNATAPVTYTWTHNGGPALATTTSNLNLVNVQSGDAGSYVCTVANIGGSVTAHPALLEVVDDTVAPSVAFTYPAANARLTNGIPATAGAVTLTAPDFFLAGSASDNGLIGSITVTRTFPLSAPLVVNETIPGPGKVAFTNQLTLVDGTNTFTIVSTDNAGNVSHTVTRTFFYVNPTTMLFVTNVGVGGLTSTNLPVGSAGTFAKFGTPTNGAPLEIGRNYQIKAVAGYNCVFTNWTDSNGLAFTTNTTLTFKMSSNLVLLANFITNPIVAGHADGKYNGLFSEEAGVSVESAGSILNFALKTNRTFSGSMTLQGKSITLAKTFDTSGDATFTISRASTFRSDLAISLHVDWSDTTHQITGTVVGTNALGTQWTSSVVLNQNHYDPTNVTYTPERLTLTIPSADTTGVTSPAGAGYAGVTNTIGGISTLSGKLADGTAIAESVAISKDGAVPISVKLYNSLGLLQGWLNYSGSNVTGSLTWIRPATNPPATYVTGFTNVDVAVTGTNYDKPVAPATVFGSATNLILSVSDSESLSLDGSLAPLVWHVELKGNSFIVDTNFVNPTNKISGSVSTADGSLSLTFKLTGNDKATKALLGNINQNTGTGAGYFIGNAKDGAFTLHP